MISDYETNIVYFSGLLKNDPKYIQTCKKIIYTLDECNVNYLFLPNTSDIWARDYMPIQVSENQFIEYQYDPDYLQYKKYRSLKTSPYLVCDAIDLKTVKTDIILDGGNVIKSKNAVILTDKIIHVNTENYSRQELSDELKWLFEVEKIIFIPWDKNEPYGHADGMIRFIDDHNAVINDYSDYDDAFKNALYSVLDENGITCHMLKYEVKKPDIKRNWAYINFLQTKDILLVPGLGIEEDRQAVEQIEKYFPDYANRGRIIQVDASSIVAKDGALNCISWTIKK